MSRIYGQLVNLNADVVRCQFADTQTQDAGAAFRMGREMCEFTMRSSAMRCSSSQQVVISCGIMCSPCHSPSLSLFLYFFVSIFVVI